MSIFDNIPCQDSGFGGHVVVILTTHQYEHTIFAIQCRPWCFEMLLLIGYGTVPVSNTSNMSSTHRVTKVCCEIQRIDVVVSLQGIEIGISNGRAIRIMPRRTKRQRHSRAAVAVAKSNQRKIKEWKSEYEVFAEQALEIRNARGRTRTKEENQLLLLALLACLRRRIEAAEEDRSQLCHLNWTSIETEIMEDFGVGRNNISILRRVFLEEIDEDDFNIQYNVSVFGEKNIRGGASPTFDKDQQYKVSNQMLQGIVGFIDKMHAEDSSATNERIRNFIKDEYDVVVSRRTVQRCLRRLGLDWRKTKPKRKTFSSYRRSSVREYLVSLDQYTKHINSGNDKGYVLVYTDESYVHKSHNVGRSYTIKGKENVGRQSGKGRRLVILHAITADGPLVERDVNGIPIDDLLWKGDTPHPQVDPIDGKKTCETLWIANSHTGDYHDNMNSDMFMKWVEERLIPVFERLYPSKTMVLICDNAPYHHKRKIGSLASLTKIEMLTMMSEYGVDWIDLPLNEYRIDYLNKLSDEERELIDRGDSIQIEFNQDQQSKRAGRNDPLIANTQELKVAFVTWAKEERPELLDCMIERLMKNKGYEILWTPPYCPDLQPIELFWAAGKNHVARMYHSKRTMKETVQQLRDAWYGTFERYDVQDYRRKDPCNSKGMVNRSIEMANKKFIPVCDGISGCIGELIVDPMHEGEAINFPIDALVLDLTKDDDELDETAAESAIVDTSI